MTVCRVYLASVKQSYSPLLAANCCSRLFATVEFVYLQCFEWSRSLVMAVWPPRHWLCHGWCHCRNWCCCWHCSRRIADVSCPTLDPIRATAGTSPSFAVGGFCPIVAVRSPAGWSCHAGYWPAVTWWWKLTSSKVSKWLSSCLTAHQHNTGYSVSLRVEWWNDLY